MPGAVLTNEIAAQIRDRLGEMGMTSGQLGSSEGSAETSLDISGLPAPIQQIFHDSYADAFGHLFMVTALIGVVTHRGRGSGRARDAPADHCGVEPHPCESGERIAVAPIERWRRPEASRSRKASATPRCSGGAAGAPLAESSND